MDKKQESLKARQRAEDDRREKNICRRPSAFYNARDMRVILQCAACGRQLGAPIWRNDWSRGNTYSRGCYYCARRNIIDSALYPIWDENNPDVWNTSRYLSGIDRIE